jgi:hypothetical protein
VRRLGANSAAEVIETREQLAMVRAAGCTHAQGYLAASEILDILTRSRSTGQFGVTAWELGRRDCTEGSDRASDYSRLMLAGRTNVEIHD